MLTRLTVILLLTLCIGGCEVRTMYEIQLPGLAKEGNDAVLRKEDYTLYVVKADSEEAPGITLIAQVDDLKPTWDWEEFQGWTQEKRQSVFGKYYDTKYPSLNVSYQNACPHRVESFDHRESAQEVAYGQWLHNLLPESTLHVAPKGLHVSVTIDQCETSREELLSKTHLLTVTVAGVTGSDLESIQIEFRVGQVGTWLEIWDRPFQIN